MSSSDDEVRDVVLSVANYDFVDENDELVSFSLLPIQWSKNKSDGLDLIKDKQIFLRGAADNGLQKVYKQVIAWKFDLSNVILEISVLSKDNNWIKLQKPRKIFEEIIRSVLITVHCLHFVLRNPEASGKSVWDHLSKVFSLYEIRPSQNDLVDHMALISEAVERNDSLAKCKFLLTFLEEKPRKTMPSEEDFQATTMSAFIVDDVDDYNCEVAEEDEEDDLFDSVCAFCDNGGDLLCCDGKCMRSFHAHKEAGEESLCETLGFTRREVSAMQNFYCKNCEYNQHQCFACGKLGSSDKSSGAEVIKCVNGTCGYFYHPHCVSKLLHRGDEVAAEALQKKIVAGEPFACPFHKCYVCGKFEDKKRSEMQFAVCRRCPTSYHKKCLPKEISLEDIEEEDIFTRAWENLLPNRWLIYCLKHEIDDGIGTPIRDHIKFPDVEEKKRKQLSEFHANEGRVSANKRRLTSEDSYSRKTTLKAKESSSAVEKVKVTKQGEKNFSERGFLKKPRANDAPGKSLRENKKSVSTDMERSATANVNKMSLGERLYYASLTKKSAQKQQISSSELDKPVVVKTATKKLRCEQPSLDADTKRRLLTLVKEAASSITLEDIVKRHEVASTHVNLSKSIVDRTITAGKVEGAVEAVRAARKKLDDGCSIEDAKAVCEPEVLNQVYKWKNKLKVHLAPFLHGMRYTSFGRHFTKVEKLKEIVDILHFYVQNGDMIVDFCCGANDFSCLMKKKLEETGKRCFYKNYDLFQPKNDFNFEKRDWMTVCPDELPKEGSQLIMGLNPPFGVHAALANKFIDKALEFEPKLLILIVPPETESLYQKKTPYELVWEDDQFLSGKSFYLPGSVDENGKQMDQWNLNAPPLYLWSRRDWSAYHKAIAQKHGHESRQLKILVLGKDSCEAELTDHPVQNHLNGDPIQNKKAKEPNCGIVADGDYEGSFPCNDGDRQSQDSFGPGKSQSSQTSRKKSCGKKTLGSRMGEKSLELGSRLGEKSLEDRRTGGKPPVNDTYKGMPRSTSNVFKGRSSVEGPPARSLEIPPRDGMRSRDEPRSCGIYRSPSGANLGEQSTMRMGDVAESIGYRSYVTELERGSDIRSQVHLNEPEFSAHLGGFDVGFGQMRSLSSIPYGPSNPHRHLGSAAELPYQMNVSAMDRYAPRLDELNHTRISNSSPEPTMFNRNGIYDPRPPQPGYHFDPSMGFAPGPRHPYPPDNSAGWLNE